MGRQQLSETTHSEVFLHVVGNVMPYFPEAQSNPSMAWRVFDALKAATFNEWTGFKKRNSQDVFRSASRYPKKTGSRDARYARVSLLLLRI